MAKTPIVSQSKKQVRATQDSYNTRTEKEVFLPFLYDNLNLLCLESGQANVF